MTPRALNNRRHDAGPPPGVRKNQPSTYVVHPTLTLFRPDSTNGLLLRFLRKRGNYAIVSSYPHFAGITRALICRLQVCNRIDAAEQGDFVSSVGVASCRNQNRAGVRRQIFEGSNMSPKKSGLWTGEFLSPSLRSSRAPVRQSNSLSMRLHAIPAPRSAGSPARAQRPAAPSASSLPTSWLGFNEFQFGSGGVERYLQRPRRRNALKSIGRGPAASGAVWQQITSYGCCDLTRPSQFTSGDGLGNHQPGSNTCGFAFRRQPASGRARDRAICPAVARLNEGRAA